MSHKLFSSDHTPEGPPQPGDNVAHAETLKLLRLRKPSRPSFRVLLGDALLGIALGVLVVVLFSLMFKPFQWMTAGVTGL